jgi:hypothetical protein
MDFLEGLGMDVVKSSKGVGAVLCKLNRQSAQNFELKI